MALVGSYRINFTDPRKGSFVIEPYTTNGPITPTSAVLHPRATRANTSLALYGQYVPNYGEGIQENMLHMLEHFCGEVPPSNPVEGQLWYDTGTSFVISSLTSTGVIFKTNISSTLSKWLASNSPLLIWYGPTSVVDNSYTTINVRISAYSITPSGDTRVTFVDDVGSSVSIPSAAIGGHLALRTVSDLGRLRIAVEEDGEIHWADVVNVPCAISAPAADVSRTGDTWFNTATGLLHVNIDGDWIPVTLHHLPLSGGQMLGPIDMQHHPITYTGLVNTSSTLTPKEYVDTAIATVVSNATDGLIQDVASLQSRVSAVEFDLPNKLDTTGGVVTGSVVFGPSGSISSIERGLDMKAHPIVNVSVTWNAADYLTATTESTYAISKSYLAQALSQHLQDVKHVEKGYAIEQPNGTGWIPGTVFFSTPDALEWRLDNSIHAIRVDGHTFSIQSGSSLDDVIELRHGSRSSVFVDPNIRITNDAIMSFGTMYVLDGQPQPIAQGGMNDLNDDTAVASKGFVRDEIEQRTSSFDPVVGATFDINVGANTLTLLMGTLQGNTLNVDLSHTHDIKSIFYKYQDLDFWLGGLSDTVKHAVEQRGINMNAIPVDIMLTELNYHKAPIQGATFVDLPLVGSTFSVVDVNTTINGFVLDSVPETLKPGFTVTLVQWDTELTFTFNRIEVVTEVDPVDPLDITETTYIIVDEPVPTDFDPLINQWKITYGWFAEKTEGSALVTRTTLDAELDALNRELSAPSFSPVVDVDDAVTSTVTLGLGHVGQYIRADATTSMTFALATQASVEYPEFCEFRIERKGAGVVSVDDTVPGVQILKPASRKLEVDEQYGVITIKRVGVDQWVVMGALAPV